mgnify:CR=1 FL=1
MKGPKPTMLGGVKGAFYVVEKRVPIIEPELLEKISKMGAQVSGGDGKIHAHVWVPVHHHKEVMEALEEDGFYISAPYERHR